MKPRRTRWRGMRLSWLGVVPFALFLFVFLVFPLLLLVARAFEGSDGSPSLVNVHHLVAPDTLKAYRTSLLLSLVTALLGGALGTLLAFAAIARGTPHWVRNQLTTLSAVTANFAGVPLAFAFIATLGTNGLVTVLLRNAFGVTPADAGFSLYSFWGLCLVYLYFQVPLMVLVVGPSLDSLRHEWQEAATSLGATSAAYWRQVVLPVIRPSVLGGTVLLFGNAFGAHSAAYALTSGQFSLVPLLIGQTQTGDVVADANFGDTLALGMIVVLAVTLVLYAGLMRTAAKWRRP